MSNYLEIVSKELAPIYEDREAKQIAKYLIADLFKGGVVDEAILNSAIDRLKNNEPLQYITGEAYFLDYCFYVNKHVLIPRPETEELVIEAVDIINKKNIQSILEVGTGSGCISIALKDKCNNVKIQALDISKKALKVANKNALKYNVEIEFSEVDFLDESQWENFNDVECVISNPPYISYEEKNDMHENVLKYEPHIALFSGDDTLIFYKKIAKFANQRNATAICEINEYLGEATKQIFIEAGFSDVEILKDMQGKDRVVKAFA